MLNKTVVFLKNIFIKNNKREKLPRYSCPECGSSSIGYSLVADTSISNLGQLKHKQNATCKQCNYSTGRHDSDGETYLKYLIDNHVQEAHEILY